MDQNTLRLAGETGETVSHGHGNHFVGTGDDPGELDALENSLLSQGIMLPGFIGPTAFASLTILSVILFASSASLATVVAALAAVVLSLISVAFCCINLFALLTSSRRLVVARILFSLAILVLVRRFTIASRMLSRSGMFCSLASSVMVPMSETLTFWGSIAYPFALSIAVSAVCRYLLNFAACSRKGRHNASVALGGTTSSGLFN